MLILDQVSCYHCGENCNDETIYKDEHIFCCEGCKTVYEILNFNDLNAYYTLNRNPGKTFKNKQQLKYDYLNDTDVKKYFVTYQDSDYIHYQFALPAIHCSSCIWLLENLQQLNKKIISARVNFIQREVKIIACADFPLSELALLLDSIGYPPRLNFKDLENQSQKSSYFDKHYLYKLGISFFCFGNIMLLSFPDYFGISNAGEEGFQKLFSYLMLVLSLPVVFYCSKEFFQHAWNGLKNKKLNMDFPISLGISVMFIRSCYEIISGTGSGFLDTLSGLVFFMLIGRTLQNFTYGKLQFDHDYKSYFPLAVTRINNEKEEQIPLFKLKIGDRLLIRNQELIPADALLMRGQSHIDYSFVTGESKTQQKELGELIYAGGRQIGNAIEVEVVKEVSQSYLTRLWNEDNSILEKENKDNTSLLGDKISNAFSIVVLAIAVAAALFWIKTDSNLAINAFTAVLIITCPCALALSAPFTLANTQREFGKRKFYLKKPLIVEKLATTSYLVFDKTGTLTSGSSNFCYQGQNLTDQDLLLIKSAVKNSNHPLSRLLFNEIKGKTILPLQFNEYPGKGIIANFEEHQIKLGSLEFVSGTALKKNKSCIAVAIDGNYCGIFFLDLHFRKNLKKMFSRLSKKYPIDLISGDNNYDKNTISKILGSANHQFYNQNPFDKLKHIEKLKSACYKVTMIGDGLNDAGALKSSNVGIAVSENINNFSPACDAIIDGNNIGLIPDFLLASKRSYSIIKVSFIISFLYNIIGLSFAVTGELSPLVAAILMPISSISIILFTTLSATLICKKIPAEAL